jgi:hypothetical protein
MHNVSLTTNERGQQRRSCTAVAAAGLACLLSLFSVGCGDSVESRANTGQSKTVKSTDPGEAAAAGRTQSSAKPVGEETEKQSAKSEPPTEEKSSAKDQTVARASAAGRKSTREITFDTLKFDIEKGEPFKRAMLTPAIEKLEGQRVRIRGYMLPSFQQSGIKQFVLVRDNMECCFGPGAALYDCIIVEMVNDQSCDFSVRPIAVEGTFSIREFKGPDDMHLAIFHLDGERVR